MGLGRWGVERREAGMTQAETRVALAAAGVVPSRRLGQNFLCDGNLARAIVADLELPAGASVVEVGPGLGALSRHLEGRVGGAVLIEFDERLAAALAERYAGQAGFEVWHEDAARVDVRRLFRWRPLYLLGNLPYSAGGAILRNFLGRPSPCDGAVVMLQREVADRLLARPRSKDYGVMTLLIGADWEVELVRVVPPAVFHPRPQVDSAVIRLRRRREELPVHDARVFASLVKRGFAERRKQLRKRMPEVPAWDEVVGRLGVPATVRAEELGLAEWVELARTYDPQPPGAGGQRGDEVFDVVDEDDRPVGRATRAEVHRLGLLHRAVHLFVFNRKGELFLQLRSRLKDVHPRRWDSSASGHLDAGEDYPQAAVRELAEELGVAGPVPRELARIAACAETGWEHVRLYRVDHHGPVRWPCAEVEAGAWFPPAEVAAWLRARPEDFASGFRKCWEIYNQKEITS